MLRLENICLKFEFYLWAENALKSFLIMIVKKFMISIKRKLLKRQNTIFRYFFVQVMHCLSINYKEYNKYFVTGITVGARRFILSLQKYSSIRNYYARRYKRNYGCFIGRF